MESYDLDRIKDYFPPEYSFKNGRTICEVYKRNHKNELTKYFEINTSCRFRKYVINFEDAKIQELLPIEVKLHDSIESLIENNLALVKPEIISNKNIKRDSPSRKYRKKSLFEIIIEKMSPKKKRPNQFFLA